MSPILLHIYGPIAIHSFGFMIVLGLLITLYFLQHDKNLQKIISLQELHTFVQIAFFAGIFGGRLWFLLTNLNIFQHWTEVFFVWGGGLSILGAVIGIITILTSYLYYKNLPVLPILDRLALYTPLLQAISRFGCFFAGCCYGKPTNLPWAIMYTDHESLAPLYIYIHPTQIYSALFLAGIFIFLYAFDRYCKGKQDGQILSLYIALISLERFCIDYLRADQEFFVTIPFVNQLSVQQILAALLFVGALFATIFLTMYPKRNESI